VCVAAYFRMARAAGVSRSSILTLGIRTDMAGADKRPSAPVLNLVSKHGARLRISDPREQIAHTGGKGLITDVRIGERV
jgi:hypothetical protein